MNFRSRAKQCVLALVIVCVALYLAPAAGAAGAASRGQRTYLALGDSLAFGYSQAKFNSLFPTAAV